MSELNKLKADLKDANSCIARRDKVIEHQESELEQLQQQLREKEARIARLEEACGKYIDALIAFDGAVCEGADALFDESEQQSLAHIRADAVEAARQYAINKHPNGAIHSMTEYAQQLRAEGK